MGIINVIDPSWSQLLIVNGIYFILSLLAFLAMFLIIKNNVGKWIAPFLIVGIPLSIIISVGIVAFNIYSAYLAYTDKNNVLLAVIYGVVAVFFTFSMFSGGFRGDKV